jgi:hypothetical protein
MSRSSAPEPGDRGQVDPLPALVAVAVVGLALSLYAGALGVLPSAEPDDDARAAVTLGAVCERICVGGRVDPATLDEGLAAAPDGYHLRIVLRSDRTSWGAGPIPPDGAAGAARTVTVRVGPHRTVPGRLRVVVWR